MNASIFPNHACTATRILEKRRQLLEIQDALEEQKDDFARKVDTFQRREDALRKKDLRLQDSLIKFNKFLQDNESKRTRAIRRFAEESRMCKSKEAEITTLHQLLKTKVAEEKDFSDQLAKNKKYQDYLKTVIFEVKGSSDDLTEIQDILDRYDTLKNTNDDLLHKMRQNTERHEERRFSHIQLMKDGGNEILNMNNEIAALQKELEQVTIASNNVESLDDGTSRNATEITTDLSQILVAVDNIVERFETQANRHSMKDGVQNRPCIKDPHILDCTIEEELMEVRSGKAIESLERIVDYMTDYGSIAEEWEFEKTHDPFQSIID